MESPSTSIAADSVGRATALDDVVVLRPSCEAASKVGRSAILAWPLRRRATAVSGNDGTTGLVSASVECVDRRMGKLLCSDDDVLVEDDDTDTGVADTIPVLPSSPCTAGVLVETWALRHCAQPLHRDAVTWKEQIYSTGRHA